MTILKKTLLIIIPVLSILTVCAILFTSAQVLIGVRKYESIETAQKTSRAFTVFENMVSDLERATADYAAWDETCAFVVGRNEDYVAANLIDETFARNRFSFMIFLDAKGQTVFSGAYDLVSGRRTTPPKGLLARPSPDNPLLRLNSDRSLSGILVLPEGSFLIASCPILTSKFEGPSQGTLLVGRELDAIALALLAQLTQLEPTICHVADERLPEEVRRSLLSSSAVNPVTVKILDRRTIAGYALIRDVFHQPAIVLQVTGERLQNEHALHDLFLLCLLLLVIGGVAVATSLTLINRMILARITQLCDFVNRVGSTDDLSARLSLSGHDELTELGSAFNRMLDALQFDIAERKRTEEALKKQEEFLRSVIDTHPGFVFAKDRQSRFLLANKTLCDLYGTTMQDVIGKSDADFNSNLEEVEHFHRDDLDVINSKRPKHIAEEKITGTDGQVRWLSTYKLPLIGKDGSCDSLLGVTIDITERKWAETALLESEGMYRAVVETTGTGYAMLDETGRILDANEQYVRMSGHKALQEIEGRSVIEWTAGFDRERNALEIQKCLAEGRVSGLEITYVDADGRLTPIEIDATCVTTSRGRRILTLCRDIAGRKQAEEDRKNLEIQMQQAQKLESLGVLAGGIAHDFNNLLMAVLGNADLALGEIPADSPAVDTIKEIVRGSRRAAELCKQMLAYSGKSRFVVEPIDLSGIVREMTHMLEVAVSKKALLRYRFVDDLPAVEADATQLRQVIMNLILNASEAIGDKSGVISVTTGIAECDAQYLRACFLGDNLAPGAYVYLEVADTGCGMDRTTLSRVFEPFYTTKFTGRGLGLTAVFGIVRGHRGAIRVESEPGRGTVFRVLFPASEMGAIRKDAETDATEWQGHGTILVVDDEETVRVLARKMLERRGFKVETASNGLEAVQMFARHPDEILCVLLDLTMPHMDGGEAFVELKKIRNDVRVILSSGYDEQEIAHRFAGASIAGFMEKPYTQSALLAILKRVLNPAE